MGTGACRLSRDSGSKRFLCCAVQGAHAGYRQSLTGVVLCLCLFAGVFRAWEPRPVYAARTLTLSAAKAAAVANSDKIDSLDIQIDSKQAAMESAVRSLREKERNMSTIRWSPLLKIKWPTKPKESESLEFQFKPQKLQYQMKVLRHKAESLKYEINEKVSSLYIDIISSQQELEFDQQREEAMKDAVSRLRTRTVEGTATWAMVEEAQKRLETLKSKTTTERSKMERSKKKLSDLLGFDVTTGYTFEEAFVQADMQRDNVAYLQQKALDDDHGVYEAQTEEDLALVNLRINWTLISGKYPGDASRIETYVQQALEGQKISKKAFKKDYDKFLKAIDEPWQGNYSFWFIKIPKEWLKGEIDGIRYVEDDPYILYQAALDYESARKESENTKNELREAVEDGYDNYASNRKAYLAANEAVKSSAEQLAKDEVLYLMGELEQEEYETLTREYEALRTDVNDALASYSQTLYALDRTTCGAASEFFKSASIEETGAARVGTEQMKDDSSKEDEDSTVNLTDVIQFGPTYSLRPIIASQEFLLSVDVPDDYYSKTGITITQFALYCDKRQVGKRTAVGRTLRHLNLSVQDVETVAIRLYNGETFIDECEINPTVPRGPLNIVIDRVEDDDGQHVIGAYTMKDNLATDTLVISPKFDQARIRAEYAAGKDAAYYTVAASSGKNLGGDELIGADKSFTYLSFVRNDIGKLVIHLYDKDKKEIGVAAFNTTTKKIFHEITAEDEAAIAAAKAAEEAAAKKAAEEAAAKEAAELEAKRREEAEKIIRRLGYTVNNKRVTYTLNHMNELSYLADLYEERNQVVKQINEHNKDYKAAKAQMGADSEIAVAIKTRLDVLNARKGVLDKSLMVSTITSLANAK